jgi:hypothetical protein
LKRCFAPLCLFVVAHLVLAGGATGVEQQASPSAVEMSLSAYAAELNRDSNLAATIREHPEVIFQLRASLPAIWVIDTGTAKTQVKTNWLSDKLAEIQSHPEKINSLSRDLAIRLAAMSESARELTNVEDMSKSSTSEPQQQLNTIFQRREFRGLNGPSEWERLWVRIDRWIGEKLSWLLGRLHLGADTGNFLIWAIIAIAFLALCYGVYRSLSGSIRRSALPRFEPSAPSDARQWTNEALAAAERGDYREAIHCAYWAGVSRLEDLNLLARDRTRTPRESVLLLQSHPDQQTCLRELARRFEVIWYGYRPASETDWSSARLQLERIGCLKPSTAATASY